MARRSTARPKSRPFPATCRTIPRNCSRARLSRPLQHAFRRGRLPLPALPPAAARARRRREPALPHIRLDRALQFLLGDRLHERENAPRRPATFKLDDPGVIVMDPDETGRPARGTVRVTPEADPVLLPVPVDEPLLPARRGFRWGTLFWSALGGLVLLGLGLGIVNLIEDLFARNQTLGYVALAFAVAAALALTVVIAREAFGLARLASIEKLHPRAAEVLLSDDRDAAAPSSTICSSSRTEPATGARPRRACRPRRRHHRRRRPDQARRARTDVAARPGSAPAGLDSRAARLDRHRGQPARPDRPAVRVRRRAAADPAAGAALWRPAGHARHDPPAAPRHRRISPSPAAWRRATA